MTSILGQAEDQSIKDVVKVALITTKPDSTIAKQVDEVLQLAGKVKGECKKPKPSNRWEHYSSKHY